MRPVEGDRLRRVRGDRSLNPHLSLIYPSFCSELSFQIQLGLPSWPFFQCSLESYNGRHGQPHQPQFPMYNALIVKNRASGTGQKGTKSHSRPTPIRLSCMRRPGLLQYSRSHSPIQTLLHPILRTGRMGGSAAHGTFAFSARETFLSKPRFICLAIRETPNAYVETSMPENTRYIDVHAQVAADKKKSSGGGTPAIRPADMWRPQQLQPGNFSWENIPWSWPKAGGLAWIVDRMR